jgi:hypothetical protein
VAPDFLESSIMMSSMSPAVRMRLNHECVECCTMPKGYTGLDRRRAASDWPTFALQVREARDVSCAEAEAGSCQEGDGKDEDERPADRRHPGLYKRVNVAWRAAADRRASWRCWDKSWLRRVRRETGGGARGIMQIIYRTRPHEASLEYATQPCRNASERSQSTEI